MPSERGLAERTEGHTESRLLDRLLANLMCLTLAVYSRSGQYCDVPGRKVFDAVAVTRDAIA